MSARQHSAPGDTPLAEIAEAVEAAKAAILDLMRADLDREWRPGLVMRAAQQDPWTDSVMTIAFWGLVESGDVRVDAELNVELGDKAKVAQTI